MAGRDAGGRWTFWSWSALRCLSCLAWRSSRAAIGGAGTHAGAHYSALRRGRGIGRYVAEGLIRAPPRGVLRSMCCAAWRGSGERGVLPCVATADGYGPATTSRRGYVRVSTDQQAQEGSARDAQQTRIRAHCVSQPELRHHHRRGYSAKSLERRHHARALAMLTRRVDAIVAVKLDRRPAA